jgi:uncharacterized protein (TIGR03067 family)
MVTLLALFLASGAAAQPADVRSDLKKMEGTWSIASLERDGEVLDPSKFRDQLVTIQGDRYVVKKGGMAVESGLYRLDPRQSPKAMEIRPTSGPYAGRVLLGIYQITEDERAVCYSLPGKPRPKVFKTTPNGGEILVIYKRVKN